MPDFALYYIPPAEHPLYRVGSELLGYDLRAEQVLPVENNSRAGVAGFDVSWVRESQQYGFHMTIGHAIQFQAERLGAIEAETESIMNLFDAGKPWELTPCAGTAYTAIAPNWACLLRYDPNQAFIMLHALVVARLSPLGTGSPQVAKILAGETTPPVHGQHRLVQYFYQHILDDFYPHFTLFNPLPVDEVETVRAGVMAVVPEPELMTVETLCLLVRPDGEKHYRIHREFPRKAYPQVLTLD